MGLINAVKEHQQRIPIEEKFMVFKQGTKGEALMIPLADIKDIDFEARGTKTPDYTTFYVKTGIALDSGTAVAPATLMVAAWRFISSASDSEPKLQANGAYFYKEWQNALESNTQLYHVDMLGFPYAIDGTGPKRATITWTAATS
tara:strand:+ start:620 stop:1054 length:435 start_codon:yes stop_codon:yes gene_type:complete